MQAVKANKAIQKIESARAAVLFQEAENAIHKRADRLFAGLMVLQWLAGIIAAMWISPKTWIGATSYLHWHVLAAIFLGGIIASFPIFLAWKQPGAVLTRHTIAVAQMLFSALLIHLTGGRIETHFHVFGSLAFLAFYRDWKVLATGTVVVALDHFLRGVFWPESVFGVLTASHWRWLEHAGWVLFEDTFLIISIRQSLNDAVGLAERQASLEGANASIEQKVVERTAELTKEMAQRKRAEQKLNVEYAVSRILAKSLPREQAMQEVLQTICEIANWDVGAFWASDGRTDVLRCGDIWSASGIEAGEFKALSRQTAFARGAGLPGRVWASGQSAWIRDVVQDANFQRIDAAKRNGLHGAFAFPILTGNGVSSVVEFFSCEIRELDDDLLHSFANISNQLSQFFERKRAEAELNFERNLLRELMDKADDRIYFKDSESRFIRSSASLARLFGLPSAEELVGKQDGDFFSNEHVRETFEDEQTIMRTGGPIIGKTEKETWPDGRVTWALSSKMPFRNVQGEIVGTIGVSKDITAIKEAEARLSQMHRQLVEASRQAGMAEVATSVLHNVGNVLNSVNVSSSQIAEKMRNSKVANIAKVVALIRAHEGDLNNFFANDPSGKRVPDYLAKLASHLAQEQQDILGEVGCLVGNIDHIREIVAMQQSYARASGVLESLQVTELVDDAIRMNNGAMNRHNVKVVRNFAAVPPVLTEKHKVLQILVNLIRNAKYACDDSEKTDKQITLRVANGDGRVKISVIDNGIGIPAENLTRIFAHGFTTRKEGHGFGLHSGAIAAKELGGTLVAFSEGTGNGATFTLELPVQEQK